MSRLGIEPRTYWLRVSCSANWASGPSPGGWLRFWPSQLPLFAFNLRVNCPHLSRVNYPFDRPYSCLFYAFCLTRQGSFEINFWARSFWSSWEAFLCTNNTDWISWKFSGFIYVLSAKWGCRKPTGIPKLQAPIWLCQLRNPCMIPSKCTWIALSARSDWKCRVRLQLTILLSSPISLLRVLLHCFQIWPSIKSPLLLLNNWN